MNQKKIHIKVSQENIDNGVCGDPISCPVSLGFTDATGWTWIVCGLEAEQLGFPKNKVKLPPFVSDFIGRFDTYQKVEPFEFDALIQEM